MNEMPSQAAIIRAWLELQSEPRTAVEIAAAVGRPGDLGVVRHVHRLWRDKFLTRSGRCKRYAFALARDVEKRPAMTSAERERKRRIRNGGRSWEQWKAECEARKAATAARLEAEKAQRRADAARERAERLAAREAAQAKRKAARAKPVPRVAPKSAVPRVRPFVPFPTTPPPETRESVEDFLRRGGKIIQLPPCTWSRPLRTLEAA